jgi:hypothetical protein
VLPCFTPSDRNNAYLSPFSGSEHIDLLEMSKESALKSVFSFYDFGSFMCEGIAKSRGIEVVKNYPDDFRFDLVLHDYTCVPSGLAAKIQVSTRDWSLGFQ